MGDIHPRVETLLAYHARPLTIIYEESFGVASNVLAPDGSVAIRITQDVFCRELIKQLGKPIVSTSANQSGQPFPTHYAKSVLIFSKWWIWSLNINRITRNVESLLSLPALIQSKRNWIF